MDATTLTIGILAVGAIIVLAVLYQNSTKAKGPAADVPVGMRPGYSDEELETSHLERLMTWGVVLTLFFAVFFPFYWVTEHSRLSADEELRFREQVTFGEELYTENCSRCHGAEGGGGAAASPYDPEASWPAPNLRTIVARYEDNRNITDIREFISQTLQYGRPGTPMPAWGRVSGGPFTDEQVEAVTLWILANQEEDVAEASPASDKTGEELFAENCARCHAPDLSGWGSDEGHPAPPLIGVFDRHSPETVLGILRNGIIVPQYVNMPPWQNGYMYPDARYADPALERIVEYLQSQQPDAETREARGPSGGA